MKAFLDSPETKTLVTSMYLDEGLPPRMIEERLREAGVAVTSTSLRQWLSRNGLTKKRRDVEALVEAKLAPAVVAEARLGRAHEALDRWADGAESVVDRALDEANKPGARIRDVSVAVSTAVQGMRLFQMSSGITRERPPGTTTFNFNFARGPGSPFHPDAVAARARAVGEARVVEPINVEAQLTS